MRMSEITFAGLTPIDGYGPGFFRVGGGVIEGAMLVTAQGARSWAGLIDPAPLVALGGEVDVILIGVGAEMAHLPPAFRAAIEAAGIGVEPMTSPAACRTYNVLLSEGRRVALAALPV
ncbi:MAG: Mth938-like domain-containing protein [Roseovarius sp.]|nr:Mth938-like domain-containing protein [Roseovarius sp.]